MSKSPYLKPGRLADVIAAIQFMSMNERSSLLPGEWAEGVTGDTAKADHWETVFREHPEFFRKSPTHKGRYALIWRRALPQLYFRLESRMVTHAELAKMPEKHRAFVSRPPVPEQQIETLIDLAIDLHEKAVQQHTDWRWWVPTAASFAGALLAVLLGVAFGQP